MTARETLDFVEEHDQDVDEARQMMAQHQLDRVLVVEKNRLVGIIFRGRHSFGRGIARLALRGLGIAALIAMFLAAASAVQ
jgi:hypothetical protein